MNVDAAEAPTNLVERPRYPTFVGYVARPRVDGPAFVAHELRRLGLILHVDESELEAGK